MRHLPIMVITVFAVALAWLQPGNDVNRWFIPAARLLLGGENVYALNAAGPFIYLPVALPLFAVFALPGMYAVVLAANVAAALWIVRTLDVSRWWLLYPPVLLALHLGTFDLPVAALALLAYRRRWPVLMTLVMLIKPQTAIFWCVPLIFEQPRALWRMALVGGGAVGLSILLTPGTWSAWLDVLGAQRDFLGAYYVNGSYSLFALAFGVTTARPRFEQTRLRALTALIVPFSRYYSGVGLLGYGGAWVVALSWALFALASVTGAPVFWIEPVAVVVVSSQELIHSRGRR